MSKGLLLDFGGVLTKSVTESFAAFCADEGLALDLFKRVVLGAARGPDSPFTLVETGAIDQAEFDRRVAEMLSEAAGKTVVATDLKQRLFARATPDDEMIAATRAARAAGVRTALVSNSWGGRDYPEELLADLFDAVVISGRVGLRKPEADIFLMAAKQVALRPPDCIFVDDFQINVDGAKAVGMEAVRHRTAGETVPALEAFLGVALR